MSGAIYDYSPARILLVIRDSEGIDWPGLQKRIGLDSRDATSTYMVLDRLHRMKAAGFIAFEGETPFEVEGVIRVTPVWQEIQATLDISLVELAKQSRRDSMIATPFFGRPSGQLPTFELFVLMPFAPEMRPIYDDHITHVANSLGVRIGRADDFFTTAAVMGDVWEAINGAAVVLADCTGRIPNVFYELGIAHTIGKPVIVIAQDADDVPFDIRHVRYIKYDYTPRGMKVFEEQLRRTLKAILLTHE
jgi:hypothetical protein